MHKAVQSAIFAVAVSGMACASVHVGENLVLNGRLATDQVEVPLHWVAPPNARIGMDVFFDQLGGPSGIPCVRFVNADDAPKSFILRQYRYTLVPGAKYRLSAQVRTRGFSGGGGLLVISAGWRNAVGISGFPSDSGWRLRVAEITMPESTDKAAYSVAVHLEKFRGEIAFADLKLEPLDEAACAGSAIPSGGESETVPRFFPWEPHAGKIDAKTRAMSFFFTGKLPAGTAFSDYDVTFSTSAGEVRQKLQDGVNAFVVPEGADTGKLSYEIRKAGDDKPLISGSLPFKVVAKPVIDTTGHRKLNNLVTEVLSAKLDGNGFSGEFHTTRDDGWIHVKMAARGAFDLSVDGVKILDNWADADEVFRFLPRAGAHKLAISGPVRGTVSVKQIPDVFVSPTCFESYVDAIPSFGWNFFRRHAMRNATSFKHGRHIPRERRAEFFATGARFFGADALINKPPFISGKPVEFSKGLAENLGMTMPESAGAVIDESYFGQPKRLNHYIDGMRQFVSDYYGDKIVHSCIVDRPAMPGSDREAIAWAVNASYGRGKVLTEIYCQSKPTEAEAKAYFDDYAGELLRSLRRKRDGLPFYPGAADDFAIYLGNFTQIPTLSLWHHPQMDYKYFLDMQFHALANDPTFEGLAHMGVWGLYYADDEMYRWTFMLTRHYCIEGNKDMLSSRYGLKYLPGILENGDFNESFDGWRVEGNATRETIYKFADVAEKRWCGKSGDTFAVLAKEPGRTTRLSQTLKNLVPGRRYSLDVVCFNAKDARENAVRPMRIPLNVTLGDAAEKIESRSWVFVDRRPKSRGFSGTRVNRHHVVFTAKATETEFCIDNEDAPDGFEIGVNGIGVWPYVLPIED